MRTQFKRWLTCSAVLLLGLMLVQPTIFPHADQRGAAGSRDQAVAIAARAAHAAANPLISGIAANAPLTCTTGTWSEQAPYPIAITGHSLAAVSGNIYSFGGILNNIAVTNAYKYDTSTNTWSTIAPLPAGREWAGAVSDGTYVYILGGIDQIGNTVGTLWRYDPNSNTYNTSLASDHTPTYFHGIAYLNGKIYRIAGRGIGSQVSVEAYTIASNTWAYVASYPYAAQRPNAVGYNGYIYAGGGNGSSSTYRYDPVANVWDDAAVPDLPAGRDVAASAFYNGRWIIASGEVNFTLSTNVIAWTPGDPNWVTLPDMPAARAYYGTGGAVAAGAFYAIGGQSGPSNPTNDNQRYVETPCVTGTPTNTPLPTSTPSPLPTNTPTPLPTNTPPPTNTPGGPTDTPANPPTATPPASPTETPGGPTDTPTLTPFVDYTPLPTGTPTASPTPTDCANPFMDITGNIFYTAIHYLNCRGVVNGTDGTHYSPAGTSTRGQFAKVVVLGFGLTLYTPPGNPDFTDVPPTYFAYIFIETGYHLGVLSGFDPASCIAFGTQPPCYLPNRAITRGQLTKLVVNAGGYTLITPTGGQQDFSDVPPSNVWFVTIETAYHNGIINGYPDHTFLPNNPIRRDEMAQIVYKGILNRP